MQVCASLIFSPQNAAVTAGELEVWLVCTLAGDVQPERNGEVCMYEEVREGQWPTAKQTDFPQARHWEELPAPLVRWPVTDSTDI